MRRVSSFIAFASTIAASPVAWGASGGAASRPARPDDQPTRVVLRADAPGAVIPKSLWGHALPGCPAEREAFFLAELLPNRSFEAWPEDAATGDPAAALPADGLIGWERGDGSIVTRVAGPQFRSPNAIRLHGTLRSIGGLATASRPQMEVVGRRGFAVEAGVRLLLRVDARREGEASLRIRLLGDDDAVLAEAHIDRDDLTPTNARDAAAASRWPRLGVPLAPRARASAARLELTTEGEGDVLIDLLSLVPAGTWRGHGLRSDRAELVDALHPTLLALPWSRATGDDLEGSSTRRWAATVGDIATRHGHRVAVPAAAAGDRTEEEASESAPWSIDGLGLYETLQWAEDLDAETLVALDPRFITHAASLIEFANGSQQSPNGALRANDGHPAPFGLRYGLWIDPGAAGRSPTEGLLPLAAESAAEASRALLAELQARGLRTSDFQPVAPPHVTVRSAVGDLGLLWQRARTLDRESRDGAPLALVAWGVNAPEATLEVALAEAAFLASLERESGRIALAVHHRLLGQHPQRRDAAGAASSGQAGLLLAAEPAAEVEAGVPSASRTLTTPAYWVHAMHALHRGDRVVPVELPPLPLVAPTGGVGIGARGLVAEFRSVRLTLPATSASTGAAEERSLDRAQAQPIAGNWTRRESDGVQVVDATGDETALTLLDLPALANARDYTLRLEARIAEATPTDGDGSAPPPSADAGLIVAFHARDGDHHTAWVLAGAAPGDDRPRSHAIERNDRGRLRLGTGVPVGDGSAGGLSPPALEPGRWYALEIVCEAGRVRCSIDGLVVHDLDERQAPRIACSAALVERTGEVLLCAVNATADPLAWAIEVRGINRIARGERTVISGPDLDATNMLSEPDLIRPVRSALPPGSLPLPLTLPPRSVTFLRLLPAEGG